MPHIQDEPQTKYTPVSGDELTEIGLHETEIGYPALIRQGDQCYCVTRELVKWRNSRTSRQAG